MNEKFRKEIIALYEEVMKKHVLMTAKKILVHCYIQIQLTMN